LGNPIQRLRIGVFLEFKNTRRKKPWPGKPPVKYSTECLIVCDEDRAKQVMVLEQME